MIAAIAFGLLIPLAFVAVDEDVIDRLVKWVWRS